MILVVENISAVAHVDCAVVIGFHVDALYREGILLVLRRDKQQFCILLGFSDSGRIKQQNSTLVGNMQNTFVQTVFGNFLR